MGTIKDLVDLTSSLISRVKDRKLASELREIQGMIGSLQSEHAKLHESNIQLMTDNAQLKKTISSLETQMADKAQVSSNLDSKLPEEAEQMLVFTASTRDDITKDIIIQHSGLSIAKGDHYFDKLEKGKYIRCILVIMGQGAFYDATPKGREYLADNDLLE